MAFLLDLHDVLEGRIGLAVIGQKQIGITDDRLQDVVEIMRHAAGELADRLHLLGLGELPLELALLARIESIEQDRLALLVLPLLGGD